MPIRFGDDVVRTKRRGPVIRSTPSVWAAVTRCNPLRGAPQAAILFDKFQVMKHLAESLDKIRKAECARLSGKQPQFI
jgi:hypothetical protein